MGTNSRRSLVAGAGLGTAAPMLLPGCRSAGTDRLTGEVA
jgi:hypothetical protein